MMKPPAAQKERMIRGSIPPEVESRNIVLTLGVLVEQALNFWGKEEVPATPVQKVDCKHEGVN